jgi:hypothetical protein
MKKKENRGHLMMVKLTDEEWQQLQKKAKLFNLPASAYVRMMLLSPMGGALGEAFSTLTNRGGNETYRETMKPEKSSRQFGEKSRMIRPGQKNEESE